MDKFVYTTLSFQTPGNCSERDNNNEKKLMKIYCTVLNLHAHM